MGRTKPGTKQSGFEKKGTKYVRATLKKRKKEKSPLKTGACVGFHDMKEEDIMAKARSAASLTPSEEGRMEMSSLVKEMASLRSVYNADLRDFGERARAWCWRGSGGEGGHFFPRLCTTYNGFERMIKQKMMRLVRAIRRTRRRFRET